jgi:hypothetical protein
MSVQEKQTQKIIIQVIVLMSIVVSTSDRLSSNNTWSDIFSFYQSCRYLEP